MPAHRALTCALIAAVPMAGCRRSPAVQANPSGQSATRGAGTATEDEPRRLCLADPGGAAPIDQQVRSAQGRAMERPLDAAAWAGVGREWVRKARLSSDPGFYLGVGGCSDVALKVEAAFTPALELKTLVLMNDHRFREARRLAEEILSRDPESFVALGAQSDALLELGLYHEAALAAQRQMSLRPGMAAFARGSYLHWLRGDTRRAREFIKDALSGRDARDPEPAAWTFAEAAAIFWHEADYGGADAVYAEALRWVPDYTPALVGRGRVAIARDQPQAAVSFLEKAHRLRPLAETAWLLGDAREMAGDARGAEQAWAEVVRQGRRGDRLTLALFYATKNRDVHEALRLAEEERAARGGIYVDDTYAWALYRAGRLAEARQASDRALRLGTRDARLLYHAGAIRLAGGDAPGGRRLVQRALALNPRFDRTSAAEAQGLLAAAPKPAAAPKQLAANATGAGR